jgi:hypothetical protein
MKFFKEPLLHFLIAGAALFAVYAWLDGGKDSSEAETSRTVHVRAADVQWLMDIWARQWHREPTADEARGLVADYLKEEILAREARAMKLDENDIVMRRRLAQKLSFLIEDAVHMADPTDDDLRKIYDADRQRYNAGARISFNQIYFNPERRADALADARHALADLSAGGTSADTAEMGDRLLAGIDFHDADEQTVSATFGPEFAKKVFTLKAGGWDGPLRSGYGLHLVHVSDLRTPQAPAFAEIRPQLMEEWRRTQEEAANRKFLAALRKKYEIVPDDSIKELVESSLAVERAP